MPQDQERKHKAPKNPNKMLVRYGKMHMLALFEHNETSLPTTPTKVIIKTERGLEIGELVGVYSHKSGNFRFTEDETRHYYEQEGVEYPVTEGGTFVRFTTSEDLSEDKHLEVSSREEIDICQKIIDELDLNMKLVDFEHIFGGERIIFYFTAEGRIDFRELVKRLAKEFQTRIEMRQIGARDEARLVSDIETCGQECCCKRYLKILKPVNMRMAKVQKATLDPSKISGHCGRLRCCLRYEDQTYQDLKNNLPRKNTWIRCAKGFGKVIDQQILTQLVSVMFDDGTYEAIPLEDMQILNDEQQKIVNEEVRRRQQIFQQRDKIYEEGGRIPADLDVERDFSGVIGRLLGITDQFITESQKAQIQYEQEAAELEKASENFCGNCSDNCPNSEEANQENTIKQPDSEKSQTDQPQPENDNKKNPRRRSRGKSRNNRSRNTNQKKQPNSGTQKSTESNTTKNQETSSNQKDENNSQKPNNKNRRRRPNNKRGNRKPGSHNPNNKQNAPKADKPVNNDKKNANPE